MPDGAAQLAIRSAAVREQLAATWLDAQINWRPSATMVDALEHGIALELRLTLIAQGPSRFGWPSQLATLERHLELRYYPLSRQYQLRDLQNNDIRSFALRAYLFDALEQLHLPIAFAQALTDRPTSYRLRIALETTALPGPLRLPALIDPQWQLGAKDYSWTNPIAG